MIHQQSKFLRPLFGLLCGFIGSAVELLATPLNIAVLYPQQVAEDIRYLIEGSQSALIQRGYNIKITATPYNADGANVKQVSRKIVEQSYDAVIGPLMSHEAALSYLELQKLNAPIILPIATNPDLYKNKPQVIPILSTSNQYASLVAKYIRTKHTKSSVLILANNSLAYSTFYRDQLTTYLENEDFKGRITHINYISGHLDISKVRATIRAHAIDFIYAPIMATDLALLSIILNNHSNKLTLFSHAGLWEAKKAFAGMQSNHVSINFNGIWDQITRGSNNDILRASLKNHCSSLSIQPWTIATWDALNLLLKVNKDSPNLRHAALIQKIRNTQFTGLLGPWSLQQQVAPSRPLPIYELRPRGFRLTAVVKADDSHD
jgi:ABC-type branched-subunit amino acid transport system substrate-binding protein